MRWPPLIGDRPIYDPSKPTAGIFESVRRTLTGWVFPGSIQANQFLGVDGLPTPKMERVIFTSSGTFTKADYPWARYARVLVVGGGGGGGGATVTGASEYSGGGGGGGGGWAVKDILLADMDASETVTIGAGGAGGTAGTGSSGGTTSFGSFLSASGGAGGNYIAATTVATMAYGAAGGVGSGGDLNGRGGKSPDLFYTTSGSRLGGFWGGDSHLSGGAERVLNSDGLDGTLGAGGGGMRSGASAGARTGGAGGAGVVIVDLFG